MLRRFGMAIAASIALGCAAPVAAPRGPATPEPPPAARQAARADEAALPGCDDPEAAPADDEAPDGETPTVDDGFEAPSSEREVSSTPPPFADLSDAEIQARLRDDIGALGPMSIGGAHSGALVAGVRMPEGANWEIVSPTLAWGTREAVEALARAIDAVAARFPDTPKAFVGNLSAKHGGLLPPHVSHQSGRDADVGYYLTQGHRWYAPANASNLDRPRTWHLLRTLIAESDVDLILVDRDVQRLLKAYALEIGEDPAWLDRVFQVGGKSARPIVFHAKGHATHFHVRFYSPAAQELGRRAYRILLARGLVAPPASFVTHVVKPGETLSHLALRYKVTPEAIKKANGLAKDVLRVNKPYKIPQKPSGVAMPAPLRLPPRSVPPPPSASATASAKPASTAGVAPCRRASAR